MGKKEKRKQQQQPGKIPDLPPDVPEHEIDVSDEDTDFVRQNPEYAGLVSRLDTNAITRQLIRPAGKKEDDDLEASYQQKLQKKKSQQKGDGEQTMEVDRVDALPVKTSSGEIVYRRVTTTVKKVEEEDEEEKEEEGDNRGVVKLTKVERRAKMKKAKREAKKLGKEEETDVGEAPQAAALAEVAKEISAEEQLENKKLRIAELGTAMWADPEANVNQLKEMLRMCDDEAIANLGLLSLLAVFKHIIPGYRIRLPTEKELEMKVSKDVKKMRYYESKLLSSYKAYLQKLISVQKQSKFQQVAVRCISTLLETAPHFNFRESLLAAVVENLSSPDDLIRKLCSASIQSLFTNEGKHDGELTVEATRLIADLVKAHNCQLHPDSIEVFMSLSFYQDLRKHEAEEKESKGKGKKGKKRKNAEEPGQLPENDRKKTKKELMTKMRDEVAADYRAAALTTSVKEKRKMQSETLSAVFETYFRILRHAMYSTTSSSEANKVDAGAHPLLGPCLRGLGKFSHLIDLDYIGDLMNYLKRLAGGGGDSDTSSKNLFKQLTVSERLHCCTLAFKVMRSNLDALNVDLQGFFVQLYNLLLEYRPGRDQGDVLAEALKIMLCEDRQHDMQKAAAFVKRLATFSLCFGSAESMAALVTLRHLLQKNVKCRNLLENDAGGGSVSGSIAKYQPYATDPNLSGALASVLWELNLLSKHYHPAVATLSTNISTMSDSQNQFYLTATSPQQAFAEFSLDQESFKPKFDTKKTNSKKRKGSRSSKSASLEQTPDASSLDEVELQKKFASYFNDLHNKENERLRVELERTNVALELYEEYKKHKKNTRTHPTKESENNQVSSPLAPPCV